MAEFIPVGSFDIVIFGGTGDLAQKKLLPALYHRWADGQIPEDSKIIGVSRSEMDDEAFRKFAYEACDESTPDTLSKSEWKKFEKHLHYVAMDATQPDADWAALKQLLTLSDNRPLVFYLAVTPKIYVPICEALGKSGLNSESARIVLEKPIGTDLASAHAINAGVGAVFEEECIYRIDHYLGKETVQNLMVLRFANSLFEPLWNATHIDHVQITVAESIGVEGRGEYYDRSGAMRDMVQNHLMQLLCLTAMEPPSRFEPGAVRNEKVKVIEALDPVAPADIVFGQYRAVNGTGGYREEAGAPESFTESYIAMKLNISNWRWAGTPFYIRTGKRLKARASEIAVIFKDAPHSIFGQEAGRHRNILIIRLQPNEGIQLGVTIKEPGPGGMRLVDVPLDMTFAEALGPEAEDVPDAYERLIMDVIRGDQTLFMRGDEVEAAWAWTDPIIEAWTDAGERPHEYEPGSTGPEEAQMLMHRSGRRWREIRP